MDLEKPIQDYFEKHIEGIRRLNIKEINEAVNAIVRQYENEGTIYVFGNGGSSATASHMVCDFNKGICMDLPKRFRFICLNDNIPILMALGNDVSFDDVFYYQLENKVKEGDMILAISGSGNSKNVIKAVKYAKEKGATIVSMTGYSGGELYKLSDYKMHVPMDDMQVAEDLHMAFDHMMYRVLFDALHKVDNKKVIGITK